MKFRLLRASLTAAAVVALAAPAVWVSRVEAQKQGAPLWYSVVSVDRVKKPDRKPVGKLPATQRAALLTVQWHLLRRVDDNTTEEADPSKEFQTGDKVKLAITANQPGYLYIINKPEGKDGVLLFPDLRINNGQNRVFKDREYIIPSYCADLGAKDCWFKMTPPAGTETMIVIFSRDRFTTLPNQIKTPYSPVKRELVEELLSRWAQKGAQMTGELTIPGRKTVRYATRVQNTNPKDNEELIAKIELTHGG
ncbi:MAG TPA: DUF4384 domain-containing protein [Blastocatellia bacterium]|nr:DUF4384 domain-containing protein [Blastocatellia bacterium]